eukprot:502902-Pleurochrysis_carterae.AAC.1
MRVLVCACVCACAYARACVRVRAAAQVLHPECHWTTELDGSMPRAADETDLAAESSRDASSVG